jgi:enoyl-CoA hydratase/carnithine racemase
LTATIELKVMQPEQQASLDVIARAGIQTWKMNFPPVNQLNATTLTILADAVEKAADDSSLAAVVLTSGTRVFSAGADASEMAAMAAQYGAGSGLIDQFNKTMDRFRELCIAVRRSPFLVIAALNGHALAGDLELAAACDLRFAADSDKIQFGVPEMDLFGALPSGGGGVQFLARLMGPSRALQFILDAKPISPKAAYAAGLVDRLCSTETLLSEAEAFATATAKKAGRIGIAAAKSAVLGGVELPLFDALQYDRAVHWDAMRRGNFVNGVANFVKRFGSPR